MSLPNGVSNRPMLSAPFGAVLLSLGRVVLLVLGLLLPWLLHAAAQAPALNIEKNAGQLEEDIRRARSEARTLRAQRATLLAPDRLRAEAKRLGLAPPERSAPMLAREAATTTTPLVERTGRAR